MAQQLKDVTFLGLLDSAFPLPQNFNLMMRVSKLVLWINDNIFGGINKVRPSRNGTKDPGSI